MMPVSDEMLDEVERVLEKRLSPKAVNSLMELGEAMDVMSDEREATEGLRLLLDWQDQCRDILVRLRAERKADEYVRADLYAALESRIAELMKLMKDVPQDR